MVEHCGDTLMDTRTYDRPQGFRSSRPFAPPGDRPLRPPPDPLGAPLEEHDSVWVAAYAAAVRAQAKALSSEYPTCVADAIKELSNLYDKLPQPFSLNPTNKR